MDGYINLWKPKGMTSFDVVRKVRHAVRVKRVGHGGTLDPLAEGVLPLFIGRATRLVEYLGSGAKAYHATVRLGMTTDTLDHEGEVLEERDSSGVSRRDVEAVLPSFVGTIQQTPPMYSALKHEGERLHRMARRGVTVERPSREIVVHTIDLTDWTPPTFTLDVVCEGGTYVRAIAADIGDRLGCGAVLDGLIRSRVGPFLGDQAVSLRAILEFEGSFHESGAATHPDWWLPLSLPFQGWRALRLNENGLQAAMTGRVLDDASGEWGELPGDPDPPFIPSAPEDFAVALTPKGEFAAILERQSEGQALWRPRKVLIDRNPGTSPPIAAE